MNQNCIGSNFDEFLEEELLQKSNTSNAEFLYTIK